ncbi:hypothetical protein [Nocardia farcinica]|uniref:hypothetical protein n=1 Tax=Nocardia farcinica TaxID=37329 RepID=UPI00245682C9|nr:hypothetical protein [Nocardia farcinica]
MTAWQSLRRRICVIGGAPVGGRCSSSRAQRFYDPIDHVIELSAMLAGGAAGEDMGCGDRAAVLDVPVLDPPPMLGSLGIEYLSQRCVLGGERVVLRPN